MKKMTWLMACLFAGIHFLTAQVGIVENAGHIITNIKMDVVGYVSQPIPWKTMISIFIPRGIGQGF